MAESRLSSLSLQTSRFNVASIAVSRRDDGVRRLKRKASCVLTDALLATTTNDTGNINTPAVLVENFETKRKISP
jgi:hypothetical protein